MNPLTAFGAKIFLYLLYKKEDFLFFRSKKYIIQWGVGTYGIPSIISFDKRSTVSVGKYVSIASNVTFLLGANHVTGLVTTYPIDRIDATKDTSDSNEIGNLEIENDVWIGYGVTIIGGIKIGNGAIIAAGAVVVDEVSPYSVVGGVPAKVIKYRFSNEYIEKLQVIKWWNWDKKVIQERQSDIYSRDIESFIKKYQP